MGDLIRFSKILKNIDKVEFMNKPSETFKGSNNGPARNLRMKRICFHREPDNIGTLYIFMMVVQTCINRKAPSFIAVNQSF